MPRMSKLSQEELDEAFDSFLKESVSDDSLDSARLNQIFQKAKEPKKDDGSPWWAGKDGGLDEIPEGPTPTGNKWLKPKKQSTPLLQVEEEDEEEQRALPPEDRNSQNYGQVISQETRALMKKYSEGTLPHSKESTYSDPLEDSGPGSTGGPGSLGGPGADTLEEMEDKARFFKQLEEKHGCSSGLDYAALNRETSDTMKTLPTGFMGTADDLSSPVPKNIPQQENKPTYSDSEDASDVKSAEKSPATKPELLAKVSLLETGDSTLNIPKMRDRSMEGTTKRPVLLRTDSHDGGYGDTGTASEMEALHAAMREAANTPTLSFRSRDHVAFHSRDGEGEIQHRTEDDDDKGEHVTSDSEQGSAGVAGKSARTVDDIIKEVMEEKLRKEMELRQKGRVADGNTNNSADTEDSVDRNDPGSRRDQRDRRDHKAVNLSPVFSDPEPQMSVALSNRSQGGEKEAFSDRREVRDSVEEFSGGGDQLGIKERLQNDDKYGSGSVGDVEVDRCRDELMTPADEEKTEGGNRGFDLRPASPVEPADQRGFGLTPAVAAQELDRPKYPSADDEKSVGSKTSSPKKGPARGSGGKKKTRFSDVKSSGYGQKRKPKVRDDVWSPAEKVLQKKMTPEKVPSATRVLSKNLMKSVESFATYIQENYSDQRKLTPPPEPTCSPEEPILSASLRDSRVQSLSRERALVAEISEWQNQWKDERRLNAKLKAEIASLQREQRKKLEELRLGHDRELHRLRQDNVVLQAKINSQDDTAAARTRLQGLAALGEDASLEEKATLMQEEIVEQETLLQGYQQENERLYREVKALKDGGKESEEKLLLENQRLNSQVGNLREIIEAKDRALQNKGTITGDRAQAEIAAGDTAVLGAGRIAELESEIKESGSRTEQKMDLLERTNHELRGHIDQLTREKNQLEARIGESQQDKQSQFQDLLSQHQHEVEGLQRKLKWYAENQDLLDKDSMALREKDETIERLREELEKGSKKIGTKTTEAQRRARERAADAKKIQDLERQVREMNGIIRRRHPNSIPALMLAAAAASESGPPDSPVKAHTTAFLEEKINKLEGELDRKDGEVKRSLRAMEQQHSSIKIQYEERIRQLEGEVEGARKSLAHPHSTLASLERELEGTRERYNKEMEALKQENNRLQQRNDGQRKKTETNGDQSEKTKRKDKEYLERIKSLEWEVESRDQEIGMLKTSCNKLMQGRLQTGVEDNKAVTKAPKKPKKSSVPTQEEHSSGKAYEPETFAGSHISDVLQENEAIKRQLEVLSLEMEQQRVHQQAAVAEAESALRRAQEAGREEVQRLEAEHRAEMERVIAERALALVDSDAARLNRQIESQKLMIKHLQDQLSEGQVNSDLLAASRVKEELHRTKMEQLRSELEVAKMNHTPEMRHFEALQSKIVALENRRLQRETDLERMVEKATQAAVAIKNKELMQYKDLVLQKNLEIERFRAELDGILDVLRELQRQGVVLPAHKQKESVYL